MVGQACQGWSKQSKVGPKLGVPKLFWEAPAGGQSWPKSQSLRVFQKDQSWHFDETSKKEPAKLKLLVQNVNSAETLLQQLGKTK